MHLSSSSCFCSPYVLVMNLGYHQNYYSLALQQRNEFEVPSSIPPRTRLPEYRKGAQEAGELKAAEWNNGPLPFVKKGHLDYGRAELPSGLELFKLRAILAVFLPNPKPYTGRNTKLDR